MPKHLNISDKITFNCRKDIECFNKCCKDVNIFLTPYDIIRLKNALEISSQEFLDKYTVSPFSKELKIPVIILKLNKEDKACPFVTNKGCNVYNDRPRACRMYPIEENSHEISQETKKDFYLIEEEFCLGHKESKELLVSEFLNNEGISKYNEMLEYFNKVISRKEIMEGDSLDTQKVGMFYLAFYNIDNFKEFVFKSSFLDKFEVSKEELRKIITDDVELLKFSSKWLRFALFGENLFKLK